MQSTGRYLIGIDLGTTNSAVAYIDLQETPQGSQPVIHTFQIPQLIAEGEEQSLPTLPSFLYFAADHESASGRLRLPWREQANPVTGVLAREQGALVPGRQVSSAKSWLSHDAVNRTAKILPWGGDQPELACSPVEASSRYLAHIRDAWNHTFGVGDSTDEESRFERQDIVLTVPASFDEEARELTVQAACDAGIANLTLLEEPLAAFYAWIITNHGSLKRRMRDGHLVLVCDVGGGTTDFSLIRVHVENGQLRFERTAIGEHLLLGGDNVDLALARRLEEKLGNPKLTLRQRNALTRQCCAAKERLLSDAELARLPVTVLGTGRSVVGGAMTAELTREEVQETLVEGFLPLTASDDLPAPTRRTGLRELGLPYATEPAITKHLAEFLTRNAAAESNASLDANPDPADTATALHRLRPQMARPDAVLFNGGFFTPDITREQIIAALSGWFHEKGKRYKPRVLINDAPEAAVAVGAAYYARVRRSGGLRVVGGSGRAYYIGVQAEVQTASDRVQAVCVMSRGTEEGTTLELTDREYMVLANHPVSFTLYSSTTRQDRHGDVVSFEESEVHRHAPLITVLRYGKGARQQTEIAVHLRIHYTEVGTLEVWCESRKTDHRWRLQFQLRGVETPDEVEESTPEIEPKVEAEAVVPEEAVAAAAQLIRQTFGKSRDENLARQHTPESLLGKLESTLGYCKEAWPMAVIRKLCDRLYEVVEGRKKSARFEARWLNLFGFCLRPGFGAAVDDWRMTQARKVYLQGLIFPKDIQGQAEWLVLWRRVAGGLTAGQQLELYQRSLSILAIGGNNPSRHLNTQVEYEGWRLLASLEHLPAPTRVALGKKLLQKIKEKPRDKGFLWSLGRLGARIPFYGHLDCVVPAESAAEWLKVLLNLPELTSDVAAAVVQLGARTNDSGRDLDEAVRQRALVKLAKAGVSDELLRSLKTYIPPARADAVRIFGESLPEGLRLSG
jgi:molecular chaperone DnaK (HSP70)